MRERHNGYDAHRVLRARLAGAQKPAKNWLAAMWPDLKIPPVALIVPPVPEKHSPPAGKAEGDECASLSSQTQ